MAYKYVIPVEIAVSAINEWAFALQNVLIIVDVPDVPSVYKETDWSESTVPLLVVAEV